MLIEAFVLGVDEGVPEGGIHLLVLDGRTVLAEELADLLAVGTVDDRSLRRALVLDGRHRGRLAEEPQEVHIDGSQIKEEGDEDGKDDDKGLDIPRAPLIETLIPSPQLPDPLPRSANDL